MSLGDCYVVDGWLTERRHKRLNVDGSSVRKCGSTSEYKWRRHNLGYLIEVAI